MWIPFTERQQRADVAVNHAVEQHVTHGTDQTAGNRSEWTDLWTKDVNLLQWHIRLRAPPTQKALADGPADYDGKSPDYGGTQVRVTISMPTLATLRH